MSQLLETIKIQDGQVQQLDLHEQRLNRSRRLLFHCETALSLAAHLFIPLEFQTGIVKCRVLYQQEIEKVEFHPYHIRSVQSLQLIYSNSIDYSFKYADRSALQSLFAQRASCDDMLIVKNGFLTDTSYANIVLDDGKELVTPAQPLLRGTKRERLLQEGVIQEAALRVSDLAHFKHVHLINALLEMGDCVVSIESIAY